MGIKVLIISDSHNDYSSLDKIIRAESPFQYLVHCGDGIGDLFHVHIPEGVMVVPVLGNVDLNRGYDMERLEFLEINGWEIMVSHGDLFGVKDRYDLIYKAGEGHGVHAVLFGHSHRKYLGSGDPVLFNPGPANKGSYGILTIGESMEFSHRMIKK